MGRTPLSRRIDLHKEIIRKRPFSFLENDPQSVYLNGKIESPKTPRYAVKILKKIGYENKSDCYLVQWNGASAGEADPSTTWEWANQLAPNCRKMVADFESSIATDPKKAWEFTDYEVEAILDRTVQGQLRYLVKWVGWRVPTWEKVKHLLPDYGELIEEFEKLNMKDIQFWTNTKKTGKGKRSMEDDLEEAEESFTEKDNGTTEVQLPISQKFPTSSSATAAIAVKAVKVLNKLDRNKERASYLMLWPEEAGERSNGEPNKSWEKRISLGTVEAILKFEEAIKKRKVWAREAVMYEVEKVLGRRKTAWAEAPQYLVKWKGYNEISWAPMESLQICFKHLLVAYALERPRTLEKGRMEASEIKRKRVPKRVKDEFGRINKRLNVRLHSSFEKFKCND